MTSPKLFFHTNIRFLRERKNISQEELARQLELSRDKIHSLEAGRTINPTAADLLKFSEYYRVSLDHLMKTDLTKVTEVRLKEYETRSDSDMAGKELRVIVTTVNVNGKPNIEHVPIKAKAGYLAGYGDAEYISSLPVYSLPNLSKDKQYRSFQSEGDSMYPFPENALIVGEYVDNWFSLKSDMPCIVVTRNNGIVFKLVTNITEERCLQLTSLNPIYEPYCIGVEDVCEVWKYCRYISEDIPYSDIPLSDIAQTVRAIHSNVKTLLSRTTEA